MKEFIDRFNNHAIQQSLSKLRERIETLPIDEENASKRDVITRFTRVCNFVADLVENSDPTLWSMTSLNNGQSMLESLHAAAANYGSNPQQNQYLNSLRDSSDNALDQLSQNLAPILIHGTENQEHSFSHYLQQVQGTLGDIESHKEKAKETEYAIEQAETDFLKRLQSTEKKLADFDSQFEQQKGRVDTLINEQQTTFTEKQTTRSEEFSTKVTELQASFDAFQKDIQKTTDDAEKQQIKASDVYLLKLEELQTRAENIVGIIANTGLTGNYAIEAKRDFWTAEVMRCFAMIFFLVAATAVCWVVFTAQGDSFDWRVALFRVGVGAALAIPAWYCAKESNAHRRSQRRNKRIQLELEAIEPYLEKLNDAALSKEILKDKVNDYFGSKMAAEIAADEKSAKSGEVTFTNKELLAIIPQLAKILGK